MRKVLALLLSLLMLLMGIPPIMAGRLLRAGRRRFRLTAGLRGRYGTAFRTGMAERRRVLLLNTGIGCAVWDISVIHALVRLLP